MDLSNYRNRGGLVLVLRKSDLKRADATTHLAFITAARTLCLEPLEGFVGQRGRGASAGVLPTCETCREARARLSTSRALEAA